MDQKNKKKTIFFFLITILQYLIKKFATDNVPKPFLQKNDHHIKKFKNHQNDR
jgi:hypothetical protein